MWLKQKLLNYSWDLAYGKYNESILSDGLVGTKLEYVRNPYPNKWFADPFILAEDGLFIQFLVEEYDERVGRGRIARIKVDKKSNWIVECSIILEQDTHLSFPAIYNIGTVTYVHPENFASGASFIYRYDREKDKLVDKRLLSYDPLTDAVIRKENDGFHMYSTDGKDPNGDMLSEYVSSTFEGPYKKQLSHCFPQNTARMAGSFIDDVRPAQDCFGEYGKAVVFYKGKEQIGRIVPSRFKYSGVHTFNHRDGTFVIDMKRYDYPLVHKAIKFLKDI